jgi:hypothetical protein
VAKHRLSRSTRDFLNHELTGLGTPLLASALAKNREISLASNDGDHATVYCKPPLERPSANSEGRVSVGQRRL